MAASLRLLRFVAAIAAAAPVAQAQNDLHQRVDAALKKARPALLAHLAAATNEGAPGELALISLAAVHDGVPAEDKLMAKALQKLAKARPEQTYDIALRLLVLEACAQVPDRERLSREDGRDLLAHRSKQGAFQYGRSPSSWDLSNTQYGALGLRAAAALGVDVDRGVWAKLAAEIGEQQDSYGGFGYVERRTDGDNGYASMTAAGIAVLAICQQALGEAGKNDSKLSQRIARGWTWFDAHSKAIGDKKERWSFYFHYGLERAAILCDVEKVAGRVDWYAEGAGMLLEEQLTGGGWQSTTDGMPGGHQSNGRGDLVPTSFAVLFLRRKFQKTPTGPYTPRIVHLANLGPASKDADVDACAQQLTARGKAAMANVVKGMRSEVVTQRRAAAKALAAIAGDTFGFDPLADRDAEGAREAVKKAELWALQNR